MKRLFISAGILVLASFVLGFKAEAHYRCGVKTHHKWCHKDYQKVEEDAEYDWVIKPEVLGEKLRIIANPAFIPAPRYNEYIVITGDPDNWKGERWGMQWSRQGYVANIPLSQLPRNKRIRMNYVIKNKGSDIRWAIFSEENDDEWTGPGDNGKTVIDFMIQNKRVVSVE